MKLIQILVLVTAMATMAAGQNSAATTTNSGGQQPASKAMPTPGAVKGSPVTKQPSRAKSAPATANSPAATQKLPAATPKSPAANQVQSPAPVKSTVSAPGTGGKPAGTAVSTAKGGAVKSVPVQNSATAGAASVKTKAGASAAVTKTGPSTAARKKTSAAPTKTGRRQARPAKALVVKVPKPATQPAKKPEAPAAAVVAAKPRIGAFGRRDPFVSPIRTTGPGGPGANCTGGKRCLSIPELVLAGTVKDISGKMMAVVVTGNKKTYTLRENDQVFNGTVEKITTDSVIFREFFKDAVGRESAREVVKKMPGPVT